MDYDSKHEKGTSQSSLPPCGCGEKLVYRKYCGGALCLAVGTGGGADAVDPGGGGGAGAL